MKTYVVQSRVNHDVVHTGLKNHALCRENVSDPERSGNPFNSLSFGSRDRNGNSISPVQAGDVSVVVGIVIGCI